MFKREIKPLSENMVDSIAKSINKLEYVEEKASRPADRAEGDVKPQDISGEEEVAKDGSATKAPARKGDQAQADSMEKVKEEVELEENMVASLAKDFEKRITKGGALASDRTQEKERMATLAMAKKKGASAMDMKNLDKAMNTVVNKLNEELDPVNPKAVKKKFDDRKDKDLDNDGDTDSSDEYLHKRRKAISKALAKKPEASVDESAELEGLDEANMSRAAKELEAYARKNGGIDKMDFMKAAMMMKKGQTSQLKKFVDDLDTEPREKILSLMDKDSDRRKEYKAAQKKMRSEEVELDEKVNTKAIQKAVDDGKSMDVIVGMFANKRTTNTDEIRKVVKDYMWKKRMKKEEVELEEAKNYEYKDGKVHISKANFRKVHKDYKNTTRGKERMMVLDPKTQGSVSAPVVFTEAKADYTINHKTFSSAVQHAVDVVKKRGFDVDEDEYSRKVTMGPRKPGKGKTNRYIIALTKGGKPTKKNLHMQVYYDEGRYELNMYID